MREAYTHIHDRQALRGEIALRDRRLERLRREVESLTRATNAKENAALRREAAQYRKALSNIAYRLERGELNDETLASIVAAALDLRGLKGSQRKAIKRAHAEDGVAA